MKSILFDNGLTKGNFFHLQVSPAVNKYSCCWSPLTFQNPSSSIAIIQSNMLRIYNTSYDFSVLRISHAHDELQYTNYQKISMFSCCCLYRLLRCNVYLLTYGKTHFFTHPNNTQHNKKRFMVDLNWPQYPAMHILWTLCR